MAQRVGFHGGICLSCTVFFCVGFAASASTFRPGPLAQPPRQHFGWPWPRPSKVESASRSTVNAALRATSRSASVAASSRCALGNLSLDPFLARSLAPRVVDRVTGGSGLLFDPGDFSEGRVEPCLNNDSFCGKKRSRRLGLTKCSRGHGFLFDHSSCLGRDQLGDSRGLRIRTLRLGFVLPSDRGLLVEMSLSGRLRQGATSHGCGPLGPDAYARRCFGAGSLVHPRNAKRGSGGSFSAASAAAECALGK